MSAILLPATCLLGGLAVKGGMTAKVSGLEGGVAMENTGTFGRILSALNGQGGVEEEDEDEEKTDVASALQVVIIM